MEGMKKIKSMSFHQYSWNSEVETTWISLIGWHQKTSTAYCIVHCISYNFIVLILHDFVSQFEILQAFFFTLLYEYDMICNWPIFQTTFVPFFKPKIDQFPKIALHLFSWTYPLHFANHYYRNKPRTTDTQWRHKSKISEKLGICGWQNMLRLSLKIWDLDWIFGRAVKAISSLGVRSPWFIARTTDTRRLNS